MDLQWICPDNLEAFAKLITEKSKQEQDEPVTTDWERIARVQNAKLMAMSDTVGGFEKLREVLDKYEATKPQTKEWVELTEYDIKGVLGLSESWVGEDCSIPDMIGFAKAIDAKLKERNT